MSGESTPETLQEKGVFLLPVCSLQAPAEQGTFLVFGSSGTVVSPAPRFYNNFSSPGIPQSIIVGLATARNFSLGNFACERPSLTLQKVHSSKFPPQHLSDFSAIQGITVMHSQTIFGLPFYFVSYTLMVCQTT